MDVRATVIDRLMMHRRITQLLTTRLAALDEGCRPRAAGVAA